MNPRTAFDMWRWPVAVVVGAAMMCLAVVAAGIALRGLMAIPHWVRPMLAPVSLMTIPIAAVVTALLRRYKSKVGVGHGRVGTHP